MRLEIYWVNLKGGSMYLTPKLFSTNMIIHPQPNNLSSKGLEG